MKIISYSYDSDEISDILVPILPQCEISVPIIHGVKFTKCEMYDSTVLIRLKGKHNYSFS